MQDNTIQTPTYIAFYGMQRDPFNPGVEDDLFFPEPVRKQRLDSLLHLAQFGNELMVVIGPKGSGKTTLLKQFQYRALKNWVTPDVNAQGGIDERKLLQYLYHRLGLKYQGATHNELQENMRQHLHNFRKQSQLPVLLIDNAEQLPVTALKRVLEMAALTTEDNKPLVRIILFSTEKIIENLKDPQLGALAAQPMRTMDLPPFNEEQTINYIKHRLLVAGYADTKPFTESALLRIYKESYGWPALINQLSHDLLASTVPSKDQGTMPALSLKASHPMRLIILLIILAAVGTGVFYQDFLREQLKGVMKGVNGTSKTLHAQTPSPQAPSHQANTHSAPKPATKPPAASLAEQLKNRNPAYQSVAKQETKISPKSAPLATAKLNTQKFNTQELPSDGLKIKRREDWILLQNPDSYTMQIASGQYLDTIRDFIEEHKLKDNIAFYSTTRKGKPWHVLIYGIYENKKLALKAVGQLPEKLQHAKPWVRQLSEIQKDLHKFRTEKTTTAKTETQESLVARLSKPKAAPVATAEPKQNIPDIEINRQEEWILRQKGRHYTLQLMANENMETINRFINAHNLKDSIALYKTTYQGKTLHVLIYGIYTNTDLAKTAISHLPAYLQELKPSIQQFSKIQRDIRNYSP